MEWYLVLRSAYTLHTYSTRTFIKCSILFTLEQSRSQIAHTTHIQCPQCNRRVTLICSFVSVSLSDFASLTLFIFFSFGLKWHFMSSSVLMLLIMLLSQAFLYHQLNTHAEYKFWIRASAQNV